MKRDPLYCGAQYALVVIVVVVVVVVVVDLDSSLARHRGGRYFISWRGASSLRLDATVSGPTTRATRGLRLIASAGGSPDSD